jgi:hypothetical protein
MTLQGKLLPDVYGHSIIFYFSFSSVIGSYVKKFLVLSDPQRIIRIDEVMMHMVYVQ